ncbi:ribonuclease H-like domain-containing protein, partial [Tanacetum coccineum]
MIVAFDEMNCYVLNQDLRVGKILGTGKQIGGLYYLDENQGGIPLNMWTECVLTATYLINRLPTLVLNEKSPYDLVYNKPPSLKHLRSFGCLAYATILNSYDKFGSRSEKCATILNSHDKFGCRDDISAQDVNHLNFFNTNTLDDLPDIPNDEERRNPSPIRHGNSPSHSGSPSATSNANYGGHFQGVDDSASENGSFSAHEENNNNSEGNDLHDQSHEELKVKYGLEKYVNYSSLSKGNYCFATRLNKGVEPKNYLEASQHKHWVDAMNAEIDALSRNNTWDIVDLLVGRKAIGSKWGIDFDETFFLVVKIVTVRCLINLAVQSGWSLFQMDINNAFLYGDLNEFVYITLPPGYFPTNETKVCKLNKSLYGLKQAPRKWNAKLTISLLENDFVQSKSDYSLFTKPVDNVFIALLVYVDDIIITGSSLAQIEK